MTVLPVLKTYAGWTAQSLVSRAVTKDWSSAAEIQERMSSPMHDHTVRRRCLALVKAGVLESRRFGGRLEFRRV